MRQDPEETGSEPRAVQESGMQPGEDESETQRRVSGHGGANEWNSKGIGTGSEEDLGRTWRGGRKPGGDRGGEKETEAGRRVKWAGRKRSSGTLKGRGGAGKGQERVPGSLFWQAGGAALQDKSHWQVRISEPSSS